MFKLRTIIIGFILILSTGYYSSQAQNQSTDTTALKNGSWALQFGIGSNFTLTSFQGATIAAKYQISQLDAIRAGITINGSTNNGTGSNSVAINDTNDGTVANNASSNSSTVSIVVQYLWYLNPSGPVHFYIGIGPSVSFGYSDNNQNYPYISTLNGHGYWIQELYATKNIQWALGGACVAGVEWFASKWLSLHADYNLTIQYQWRNTTSSTYYSSLTYPNYIPSLANSSTINKSWSLNSAAVSFGVNIYL